MKNLKSKRPPKFGEWLIELFCKKELTDDILGDLHEYFNEITSENKTVRISKYYFQLFSNLRPSLLKKITGNHQLNFLGMLQLNFKISLRLLIRNKLVNSISILGLILGMISFQFIIQWINNEHQMDEFHEHKDQLYITAAKTNQEAKLTSLAHTAFFQLDFNEFPEIKNSTQIHVYDKNEIKLDIGTNEFEGNALVVDSTFLDLFSFRIIAGDSAPLIDPQNIVLTQSYAELLYGNTNPLGKIIELKCDQKGTYQVAAVIADLPSTSSIHFDFLVPKHSQQFWRRIPQQFLLTNTDFNVEVFNKKIKDLGRKNSRFNDSQLSVYPLSKYYFDVPFPSSIFSKNGNRNNLKNMKIVAALIWLVSLIGFVNLQATLQLSRFKENGIQRLLGSKISTLIGEIILNRVLLLFISLVVSLIVLYGIGPNIQHFLNIRIDNNLTFDLLSMSINACFIWLISVLISLYYLRKTSHAHTWLTGANPFKIPKIQRLITTLQYSLTFIIIICTVVVYFQVDFLRKKPVGFNDNQIIQVNFFEMLPGRPSSEERKKRQTEYDRLKNHLVSSPLISSHSQGDLPIGEFVNSTSWKLDKDGETYSTQNQMIVDPNYARLLDLNVIKGRFFADSLDSPRENKVVVNQAALNFWGIKNIEDAKIKSNTSGRTEQSFHIIGVLEDYHYQDLSYEIAPLIMQYKPYQDDPFLIKFTVGNDQKGLAYVENLFRDINPKGSYNYKVLKYELDKQYAEEASLGKIYLILAAIALTLSSLGMFTFAYYEIKRRTKEIGIRIVNGARPFDILQLLSWSFLKSLLIAISIALPFAYYFTNGWLANFASRIDLNIAYFILTGFFMIILTQLIVGNQIIKTTKSNPSNYLRDQ